jgi:hypothetical protein
MFSLRTLFLAVAVAALGTAALVAQTRYWTSAFVGVALTIIIAATVVAVYRRSLSAGVFSGVAWLYMVVVLSSHFSILHVYAPTTTLLIEIWKASHKSPAPTPQPPSPVLTPPVYFPGDGSSGYGRVVVETAVASVEHEELYKRAILTGFADVSEPKFLHYYASGQMLCTLIIALIASQCAVFFLRPRKNE